MHFHGDRLKLERLTVHFVICESESEFVALGKCYLQVNPRLLVPPVRNKKFVLFNVEIRVRGE